MKLWSESHIETIDQRHILLPPLWNRVQPIRKEEIVEKGQQVHQSGPGGMVAKELVKLIKSAHSMVAISSFLVADQRIENAILEASSKGVGVYLMIASEAKLGNEPRMDSEFDKKTHEEHKAMLKRIGGKVLIRSAMHFHAKVVIVDPFMSPKGILLTSNLTKEALDRNEELAVELKFNEVLEVASILRWAMWEEAEHEMSGPRHFKSSAPLKIVDAPDKLTSGIVYTSSKSNSLFEKVIEIIDSAKKELVVSSFGWGKDHLIIKRICEQAQKGVKVTVYCRERKVSMDALIKLKEAGAKIYGFRWLHAKAVIADSSTGIVMTANLEPRGMDMGFELGVVLGPNRSAEVLSHLSSWQMKPHSVLHGQKNAGDILGAVRYWKKGDFSDGEIKQKSKHSLPDVVAQSADNLTLKPDFPKIQFNPYLAHENVYKWKVVPPILHSKAKEVKKEIPGGDNKDGGRIEVSYNPPVFKEPKGRIVVAIRLRSQLKAAIELQNEVRASAIVVQEGD